jgi:hypothetical protein
MESISNSNHTGHVGSCNASKGMHASKHFINTTHPIIVALPDKPWKWYYVDKIYGLESI